jgi:hypothetical protein
MKHLSIFFLVALISLSTRAQLTSLSQDFNSSCPLSGGWLVFNPIPLTYPDGAWKCTTNQGRLATGGIMCSGYYGTPPKYNLDTSILVTPALNLSAYTDIYINFDTKTTLFNLGARLEVVISGDSSAIGKTTPDTSIVMERTGSLNPVISPSDEADWVTHQLNLTIYKNIVPLYVGFRYISKDGTSGSTWYIDNVFTTTTPLSTPSLPTSSQHQFSVHATTGSCTIYPSGIPNGTYSLRINNVAGSTVSTAACTIAGNTPSHIPVQHLSPGLYIIQLTGAAGTFITKSLVQ